MFIFQKSAFLGENLRELLELGTFVKFFGIDQDDLEKLEITPQLIKELLRMGCFEKLKRRKVELYRNNCFETELCLLKYRNGDFK